ncbi:uncharacterized protein B0P05DRAFT_540088 [Gilbertella persicaria]|uniref:uncharacterized protein n=1 Tax=Gilbertella persicaria TaxID=101096 RepID=UPI00221E88E2|nr:uncharacterized protein B0P05DRAFT_540088 [Gilbertella persicaria]KAI8080129.1 hypothetical protein B0P05DRAFT_540088 [Gilbertella persicaria]
MLFLSSKRKRLCTVLTILSSSTSLLLTIPFLPPFFFFKKNILWQQKNPFQAQSTKLAMYKKNLGNCNTILDILNFHI